MMIDLQPLFDQLAEKLSKEIHVAVGSNDTKTAYMNKQETCKYLHVSNNTLSTWIAEQGFPTIRVNSTVRFDVSAVNQWLADHTV